MVLASTDCMATLSAWSAFITAIVAFVALLIAWCQIGTSNSMRTTELIAETYRAFVQSDDMMDFFSKIWNGDQIDWKGNPAHDRLLNRSLTLFDTLSYLETQGLLRRNATAWEYVASEIQYFAANDSVWEYIDKRVQDGRHRYPDRIIAFTGFPALLGKVPKPFRAKDFPCVPKKYETLYNQLK